MMQILDALSGYAIRQTQHAAIQRTQSALCSYAILPMPHAATLLTSGVPTSCASSMMQDAVRASPKNALSTHAITSSNNPS